MRKFLSVLLALVTISLTFSGCSEKTEEKPSTNNEGTASSKKVAEVNPDSDFEYETENNAGLKTTYIQKYVGKTDTVVIPEKIKGNDILSIDVAAFENSKIKSVTFPKGLKTVLNNAFNNCKGLQEIVLNEGLLMIRAGAFRNCESLERITIPKSIEVIDEDVFEGCISLKSITFEGNAYLSDLCFKDSPLQEIVFSENTKGLYGRNAFANCATLKELTIPKNVETIQDYYFYGCENLKKITFEGNAPKELGKEVFGAPNKDVKIYYKKGATGFKESHLAKDYTLVEY